MVTAICSSRFTFVDNCKVIVNKCEGTVIVLNYIGETQIRLKKWRGSDE